MHFAQLLGLLCVALSLRWPSTAHSPALSRGGTTALNQGASMNAPRSIGARDSECEHEVFDALQLRRRYGISEDECVWMELRPRDRLYHHALKFVAERSQTVRSFAPVPLRRQAERLSSIGGRQGQGFEGLHFGIGAASFQHTMDGLEYTIHAVHQRRGPAVGTSMDAVFWQNLVLFVEGSGNQGVLEDLCRQLAERELHPNKDEFAIYRFDAQRGQWSLEGVQRSRPLASVILEASLKDMLLRDIDDFLAPSTHAWYTEHGIPYRRCYLLHGPPGTGKTSFIQAVAGKHRMNLCVLQPDQMLTDLKLAQALRDAPPNSVIAIEDVEEMTPSRHTSAFKNQVSFSGLLNALDGVANGDGRIFMLTSNHREALEGPLVREGRVDVDVEFAGATEDKIRSMFLHFYPGAAAHAEQFTRDLMRGLGEQAISMAALQDFFVRNRLSSAEHAGRQGGPLSVQCQRNAAADARAGGAADAVDGHRAAPTQRPQPATTPALPASGAASGRRPAAQPCSEARELEGGAGSCKGQPTAPRRGRRGGREGAGRGDGKIASGPAVFVSSKMEPNWS